MVSPRVESFDPATTLHRRGFLSLLGVASLLTQACGDDGPDTEHPPMRTRAVNLPVNIPVSVLRAKSNQSISSDSELLSIDNDLAQFLSLGDQCRILRSDGSVALYTVGEVRPEIGNDRIRMGLAARTRLGTSGEFPATLQTTVIAANLTDAQAQAQSEFVERLIDNGNHDGLVALAPHGGSIERYTDEQAAFVATTLAAKQASAWYCKGYKQGGGAFDRWHITSTDLSRNSFPGLDQIADRQFSYAVSFHGFSADMVLIGGGAPLELKNMLHAAIVAATAGSGITVEVASPLDEANGDSPSNIVNWMTAGGTGGVQIEQSMRAREVYGLAIAGAVASVFDQLI